MLFLQTNSVPTPEIDNTNLVSFIKLQAKAISKAGPFAIPFISDVNIILLSCIILDIS